MNGAIARILLRYLVGAGIAGSTAIGSQLATDPDIVMIVSVVIGAAIEGAYVVAKRRGWAT